MYSADEKLVEGIARAICEADGVDPDKECCGLGVQMPYGEIYPAWKARVRQAIASLNTIWNWEWNIQK